MDGFISCMAVCQHLNGRLRFLGGKTLILIPKVNAIGTVATNMPPVEHLHPTDIRGYAVSTLQLSRLVKKPREQEWTVNDMRLGDLDALTDVIEGTDWYHLTEIGTMAHGAVSGDNAWFREGDIFKALAEAPTIDAVPVVRCKDCKHWTVDGLGHPWCDSWADYQYHENVFCSYGERKDGE